MVLGTHVIHYNDVIMGPIASQITSLTIFYSIVYSDADQRKHQSSASLAFVRGIHRGPVNSPHKWPVTRKMFPFDDVIMPWGLSCSCVPGDKKCNGQGPFHKVTSTFIVLDVYIYYVPDMINVWILFLLYPPPLDVSAHGHSILNNGLDNTEWALYFGAEDEPLASCMIVHFRVFGFQK